MEKEYIYIQKNKYLDTTGGLTGTNILGWGNKSVESMIIKQLKKFLPLITNIFR